MRVGDGRDYRSPMPDLVIRRVSETSFVAALGGVEVGWASLAVSEGVWEVYRTVTAPQFEGRGIASRLTRFVLDAAEEAGVTVIPSCWYVDGLMARSSPRYDHLRAGQRAPAEGEGDACRIAPAVLPRTSAHP
jgi:predicted GNAT family acetyltransferase